MCGNDAAMIEPDALADIATSTEFFGVNYYFPEVITNAPGPMPIQTQVIVIPDRERTTFGWEVAPEGLVTLLKRITRDYQPTPIYSTENGSTYEDVLEDDGSINYVDRRYFFMRHLAVLRVVIARYRD
jgi:beta-glucosidase